MRQLREILRLLQVQRAGTGGSIDTTTIERKLDLILKNIGPIMTISAEVQTALDKVRQTQTLVQSVDAGIKVNNSLITDLQAQIAALQVGGTLSAEDKAALAETAADLDTVNTQLAADIPANVPTPAPDGA